MPNYPSQNTLGSKPIENKKQEPETVKAVASAKIKKSKWQEFASAFFEEDIQDVKGYIFKVVFVKGVKDIIFEAFRAFWYPGGGGGRKGNGARKAHTSYDRYYDDGGVPFKPELIQYFVPGRYGLLTDILIDFAGFLTFALITFGVFLIVLHAQKKKENE